MKKKKIPKHHAKNKILFFLLSFTFFFNVFYMWKETMRHPKMQLFCTFVQICLKNVVNMKPSLRCNFCTKANWTRQEVLWSCTEQTHKHAYPKKESKITNKSHICSLKLWWGTTTTTRFPQCLL